MPKIDINDIAKAFHGMGPKISFGNSSLLNPAQYWVNTGMSPYFKTTFPLDDEIKDFQLYLNNISKKSPFNSPNPYITLLNSKDYPEQQKLKNMLLKNGWKDTEYESQNYMFWQNPMEFKLPSNFKVEWARYDPTSIICNEYFNVICGSFDEHRFSTYLRLLCETIKKNIFVVLIKNSSNKVAAGGLVSIGNDAAYLCCGAVLPEFRGVGLWRCLVAARQEITSHLVDFWVCSSRNDLIKNKGDFFIPITNLYKINN